MHVASKRSTYTSTTESCGLYPRGAAHVHVRVHPVRQLVAPLRAPPALATPYSSVKRKPLEERGQLTDGVIRVRRCDMEQEAALRLSTQPGMYTVDRALVSIWFSSWSLRDRSQPLNTLLKLLASKVLQIRKKSDKAAFK
ncbi:hypothetical protein PsorP6_003744 [Peronosclerospora sorghi]|uniref:Uncharacterized protein n=1 Tax=Peronosclerospora sorghi TaxID=230839 RepID=A0ACC0VK51_9STRA|nr:hypothetical protein PsorP6_003744 [Peronosclerospora sorghi]